MAKTACKKKIREEAPKPKYTCKKCNAKGSKKSEVCKPEKS
jgi:hypothetical protein